MPWTVDDPPRPAKNWTLEEKRKCVKAANAVLRDGGTEEDAIFACIRAAGRSTKSMDEKESLGGEVVKALESVIDSIKDRLNPPDLGEFILFKSSDGGYAFFAKYSNKWRDRDNPPEIISEQSHVNFTAKAMAGDVPMPELWLWHVNGSAWGKSAWVGYSDGFALAAGHIYPEFDEVAESLVGRKDILLSHGMPVSTIKRDPDDQTIIVEHETTEISVLPKWAAANKHTSFVVLKETNMNETKTKGFSDEDKAKLAELGIKDGLISMIELSAREDAKSLDEAGVESKETSEDGKVESETETESPAEEVEDETAVDEVVTEEGAVEETVETEETIDVLAMVQSVDDISKAVDGLITVVGALNDRVVGLAEGLQAAEEKAKTVEQVVTETPLASKLAFLQKSVIGEEETRVDGRTALAQGPQETDDKTKDGLFFFQKEGWAD